MTRSQKKVLAGFLSLLIPGLGQMWVGQGGRGAAILIAVIIAGNLNAIWLSLYALTPTELDYFWVARLPRLLHDLFAAYGIIFWIWQVRDAMQQAKVNNENTGP